MVRATSDCAKSLGIALLDFQLPRADLQRPNPSLVAKEQVDGSPGLHSECCHYFLLAPLAARLRLLLCRADFAFPHYRVLFFTSMLSGIQSPFTIDFFYPTERLGIVTNKREAANHIRKIL